MTDENQTIKALITSNKPRKSSSKTNSEPNIRNGSYRQRGHNESKQIKGPINIVISLKNKTKLRLKTQNEQFQILIKSFQVDSTNILHAQRHSSINDESILLLKSINEQAVIAPQAIWIKLVKREI
ncbi:unnamed protein product [Adineta steineri]|uniref:Uncharacterized protein n=1 Tax=Adineta steineri TaxID=433720 RepID=A0A819PAQ9_9BILA|nr:unnamed protein product [Adineta steineri]